MKTCLLIVLSCWIFIAALVFSLVIVGVIAGLYLEKEGCK